MTTSTAQIEIPVAEFAALAARAASLGVSLPYYLGVLVLQSAYGAMHPEVAGFRDQLIEGRFRPGKGVANHV